MRLVPIGWWRGHRPITQGEFEYKHFSLTSVNNLDDLTTNKAEKILVNYGGQIQMMVGAA